MIRKRLSNFTRPFHQVDSSKVRTKSSRFSTYLKSPYSKSMQMKKLRFSSKRRKKIRKSTNLKRKRERLKASKGRILVAVGLREAGEGESTVVDTKITKRCHVKLVFRSVEPSQFSLPLSLKPMHPSINLCRVKSRVSLLSIVRSLTKRMTLSHIVKSMTSISSLRSSQR